MILLITTPLINIHGLEQRLIQVFAHSVGSNFLHELMYMGMTYNFKYSISLNLENIKGSFYLYNIFLSRNLISTKPLFKSIGSSVYNILKYNSFSLFKKFYNILNIINPILNTLDFTVNIGARSNKLQYQQIVGVRGFFNTSRKYTTKFPLLKNFERGLNLFEYIISAYGARKGLLDTSIQTAVSGYLTRRLVEIVHDVVLKESNCGSNRFLILRKYNTVYGSLGLPDFNILFNKYIYYTTQDKKKFYIKSPILCYSGRSFCNKCLGFSYNTKSLLAESVGVISGESLGEPSTQLTLRTFHTGGALDLIEKNLKKFRLDKNYVEFNKSKIAVFLRHRSHINKYKLYTILNKYKYIIYLSNIKYKYYRILDSKFLNSFPNSLIVYKFNNLFTYPLEKSFIKYYVNKLNLYELTNIFINFYSVCIFTKNMLNEWINISVIDNINYSNINVLNFYYKGGLYIDIMLNYIKFSTLINYIILA